LGFTVFFPSLAKHVYFYINNSYIMKRIILYLFVAVFASSALFYTFTNSAVAQDSDHRKNDDNNIVVGHFLKDGLGIPEMDLSFEEAVYLIQENNDLTEEGYSYTYTKAWIETLKNIDGSSDYYLASRATVIDRIGDTVYSCSSFYLPLERDGDHIVLHILGED